MAILDSRAKLQTVVDRRQAISENRKAQRRLSTLQSLLGRGAATLLVASGTLAAGVPAFGLMEITDFNHTFTTPVQVAHDTKGTKSITVPDSDPQPFSPNYKLTGAEEARDKGALRLLLGHLPKGETITSVTITGDSSAESSGQIITPSTPKTTDAYEKDKGLAVLRADAARTAFEQVASDKDVPVHVSGQVDAINSEQGLALDLAADSLNMSVDQMVSLYDQDKLHATDPNTLSALSLLNATFRAHRDVRYQFGIDKRTVKTVEKTVTEHGFFKEYDLEDIALVTGILAAMGGTVSIFGIGIAEERLARFRAKRELKRQTQGKEPSSYYQRILRKLDKKLAEQNLDKIPYAVELDDAA